ncbi:MAG TPA: DUF5335 family protein [Vicinamibacterales bacterium]
MTTARTIPQNEWQSFFDTLSGSLLGKRVEVEAATLELGDQVVAEWLPLIGITFDSRDDLLDVALVGLNHLIRNPEAIRVEEGPEGIRSIAVQSKDGTQQVLRLKDPLTLSGRTAAGTA